MAETTDPRRASRGADAGELTLAATVAHRFYLDEATKQAIAEELGISRFKVARLLDQAKEAGLVDIRIHPPLDLDLAAGDVLRRAYGLAEAWVAGRPLPEEEALRQRLGGLAAAWLGDHAPDGGAIGLSWGRTIGAMVDAVEALPRCKVVQVAGGLPSDVDDGASWLVHRLAASSGGTAAALHAPLLASDRRVADSLRVDPANAATLAAFAELDVLMVGVGAWDPAASSIAPALTAAEADELARRGVVAEVCGMFLAADGALVEGELRGRTIAIRPEEVRAVPRVVVVAGGTGKVEAVRALLRSGMCTHLVTDAAVAEALVGGDDAARAG